MEECCGSRGLGCVTQDEKINNRGGGEVKRIGRGK